MCVVFLICREVPYRLGFFLLLLAIGFDEDGEVKTRRVTTRRDEGSFELWRSDDHASALGFVAIFLCGGLSAGLIRVLNHNLTI